MQVVETKKEVAKYLFNRQMNCKGNMFICDQYNISISVKEDTADYVIYQIKHLKTPFEIEMRKKDNYINITKFANANGKCFGDWHRLKKTTEYIETFHVNGKAINPIDRCQEGLRQTIFGHPHLALIFVGWCKPIIMFDVSLLFSILNLLSNKTTDEDTSTNEFDEDPFFDKREIKYINDMSSENANIDLRSFKRMAVCYIVFIEYKDGKFYFKFGRSERINKRLDAHSRQLDATKIIAICPVLSGVWAENKFKKYLRNNHILTTYGSGDDTQYEIFTTSSKTLSIIEITHELYQIALQNRFFTMNHVMQMNLEFQIKLLNKEAEMKEQEIQLHKQILIHRNGYDEASLEAMLTNLKLCSSPATCK